MELLMRMYVPSIFTPSFGYGRQDDIGATISNFLSNLNVGKLLDIFTISFKVV